MLNTVSNPQFFRFNRMKPSDTEFSCAKAIIGLPHSTSISVDLHKAFTYFYYACASWPGSCSTHPDCNDLPWQLQNQHRSTMLRQSSLHILPPKLPGPELDPMRNVFWWKKFQVCICDGCIGSSNVWNRFQILSYRRLPGRRHLGVSQILWEVETLMLLVWYSEFFHEVIQLNAKLPAKPLKECKNSLSYSHWTVTVFLRLKDFCLHYL